MKKRKYQEREVNILAWRLASLPALVFLGLVIIAHLLGFLQPLELATFDTFMRLRPTEPIDERVVIIGIDEEDINTIKTYPIPDEKIAQLIETLEQFKPRAIGLDIVRDLPVEPGHAELIKVYQENPNVFGVEKVLQPSINPPPELPPQQIGFADVLFDRDGKVRRALLGMPRETAKDYAYSFAIRLAEIYFSAEGIKLENGQRDPKAMQFGSTELSRFQPDFDVPHLIENFQKQFPGLVIDYIQKRLPNVDDDFGVQTLINFRNNPQPFHVFSLQDIEKSKFDDRYIRDHIVIIGMTAASIKDLISTSAIAGLGSEQSIYGVTFHAHVVSQILSAVEDGRPLLKTWSDGWEYLWIIGWGFVGMSLSFLIRSPSLNFLYIGLGSLVLVVICYLSLYWWGYWLPVVPAMLVLISNGIGLFSFYQYHRTLKAVMDERQRAIEHTFTVIHNGPLQLLANLLRQVRDRNLPSEHLIAELENLNREIREVGEYLKGESLTQENSVRLGNRVKLDLKRPIHELFYEVFSNVLERDLPCLETLKVKVRSFEPIEPEVLSQDQKRELCEFLEEVLCNVGKHAQGVTRLSATGNHQEGWYTLSIKDNGLGKDSNYEGRGTKQCKHLAKQLRGYFTRETLSPQGMLCELTWFMGKGKK